MNRLQKKIITIAMALANISLTTIVATTATFAWFVNNKVVSASGIEMSISADTGVDLRYEVIKYDDDIKDAAFAVFNHLLELWAVVRFCRDGTVNVVFDHRESVLLRIGSALPNLTFDGFFTLAVSRIAGIDHSGHGKHLPFTHH